MVGCQHGIVRVRVPAPALLLLVLLAADGTAAPAAPPPVSPDSGKPVVVLMHGLLGTSEKMAHLAEWIEGNFSGAFHILNVQIGDEQREGKLPSLLTPMNRQCELLRDAVLGDAVVRAQGGVVDLMIGQSQGVLNCNCFVRRYGAGKVRRLVSLVGPQNGVFGVPFIGTLPGLDDRLRALMDRLLDGDLSREVQDALSFASYWKDPLNHSGYLAASAFLADINNERAVKNVTYKDNVVSLELNMWLYSTIDGVVIPRESERMEFYTWGQNTTLQPFNETGQYKGDWLGLRSLDSLGRLSMHPLPCHHEDVPQPVCLPHVWKHLGPILQEMARGL